MARRGRVFEARHEVEIARIAHIGFTEARARRRDVTSVDKANVLEASRLWRAVVERVAREYPDVDLEHRYVDAMSFEMLQSPQRFDVNGTNEAGANDTGSQGMNALV